MKKSTIFYSFSFYHSYFLFPLIFYSWFLILLFSFSLSKFRVININNKCIFYKQKKQEKEKENFRYRGVNGPPLPPLPPPMTQISLWVWLGESRDLIAASSIFLCQYIYSFYGFLGWYFASSLPVCESLFSGSEWGSVKWFKSWCWAWLGILWFFAQLVHWCFLIWSYCISMALYGN